MNRSQIIVAIKATLKNYNIKRASLFGSFARNEKKYNDIDVAIDPPAGFTLLDLVDVETDLKKKIKKKVEIVTFKSLSPYLKPYIKKDLVVLYEGR